MAGVGEDGRPLLTRGQVVTGLISANLYILAFGVSWGPVMWVLQSEIFPNRLRSALAVC
jgi:SP family sugar:H+ symporter-like MFS transporter